MQLGSGSKGSLSTKGRTQSFSKTFSARAGLRSRGVGAKAVLAGLYPAIFIRCVILLLLFFIFFFP